MKIKFHIYVCRLLLFVGVHDQDVLWTKDDEIPTWLPLVPGSAESKEREQKVMLWYNGEGNVFMIARDRAY